MTLDNSRRELLIISELLARVPGILIETPKGITGIDRSLRDYREHQEHSVLSKGVLDISESTEDIESSRYSCRESQFYGGFPELSARALDSLKDLGETSRTSRTCRLSEVFASAMRDASRIFSLETKSVTKMSIKLVNIIVMRTPTL